MRSSSTWYLSCLSSGRLAMNRLGHRRRRGEIHASGKLPAISHGHGGGRERRKLPENTVTSRDGLGVSAAPAGADPRSGRLMDKFKKDGPEGAISFSRFSLVVTSRDAG